MKTITDWFREQEGWRHEPCYACNATGMTSNYGCGEDFYGPEECRSCKAAAVTGSRPEASTWNSPVGNFYEGCLMKRKSNKEQKKLADDARLLRAWKAFHREERETVLAGPHGS